MTWEETPKDLEAYQAALDAQATAGVDSRIAEGRARSKAVRTWRAAVGSPPPSSRWGTWAWRSRSTG